MIRTLRKVLVICAIVALVLLLGIDGSPSDTYLTAHVVRGALSSSISATGTLDAVITVDIGSELSGRIAKLSADFNDKVKQGSPLATLDQTGFTAKVKRAEAELEIAQASQNSRTALLEKAKADLESAIREKLAFEARVIAALADFERANLNYGRTSRLAQKRAMSQKEAEDAAAERKAARARHKEAQANVSVQEAKILAARAAVTKAGADVQDAKATIKQKEAALQEAEYDLKRTVIRSPIDGVVIGREIDVGQTVAATLEAPKLFVIAKDLREMEVHARVDEADIGAIEVGQECIFTVDAFPGRTFRGKVLQVRKAPEVTQNVVTYTVVVTAKNEDSVLLPGMTALVRITTTKLQDVLKVPSAALQFKPNSAAPLQADKGPSIWLLGGENTLINIPVTAGLSDGAETAVKSEKLREGQKVVVGVSQTVKSRRLFGIALGR